MRINLEVNNLSNSPIEKIPFEKITKAILEKEVDFLINKSISVNLTLVNEEQIRVLNKKYRNQDSSTDVLSFSEFENKEELEKETDEEIFLGELILCYHDIEKYASQKGIDLDQEITEVFVHGLLHLLGHEHGEKMFGLQKELIKNFF